ncbi:MAG: hypothetical protein HC893_14835 [Chloroflexaceae bacterium]|nr:hypothetical protein [Chloroflexaceae bacterium]
MQRQTTISIWSERLIEAGWLASLSLIPIYFNLMSARHFEPDKATTLRALVLMMAALGLIRVLEMMNLGGNPAAASSTANPQQSASGNPLAGCGRGCRVYRCWCQRCCMHWCS